MTAMATELFVVDEGDYYTDGRRLYYIIKVNDDSVLVENCETEFTANVAFETIHAGWRRVKVGKGKRGIFTT